MLSAVLTREGGFDVMEILVYPFSEMCVLWLARVFDVGCAEVFLAWPLVGSMSVTTAVVDWYSVGRGISVSGVTVLVLSGARWLLHVSVVFAFERDQLVATGTRIPLLGLLVENSSSV